MRILKYINIAFLLTLLVSCNSEERYLRYTLRIIKKYSVKRATLDWRKFKGEIMEYGKDDSGRDDTYATIRYALSRLNDNHSFLSTPKQVRIISDSIKRIPFSVVRRYDDIGYIRIPGFTGNDSLAASYASSLLRGIMDLDTCRINGWIIDLRNNGGGNMWPMLLGIGPLMGDGDAGYFVYPDGKKERWGYSDGMVYLDEKVVMRSDTSYVLRNSDRRTAILINRGTGSSGEAIALSFRDAPKTLFFGEETCGLTTGNIGVRLKDGAMLYITACVMADRSGRKYGKEISPGVYTNKAFEEASDWIHGRGI